MMKAGFIIFFILVDCFAVSALTCPEWDGEEEPTSCKTFQSWLCGYNHWAESVQKWKERVEELCSAEDLGAEWEELFSCPDLNTAAECVNASAQHCEKDPLNCTICYCQDGKYRRHQHYFAVWRSGYTKFRSAVKFYEQKLKKSCDESLLACSDTESTDSTTVVDTDRDDTTGCRKAPASVNFCIRKNNVIDLTYPFNEDSSIWPTFSSGFQLVNVIKDFILEPVRFFLYSNTFTQPEHTGTHMDAPSHFQPEGNGAGEVSLYDLIGTGVLLNMKKDGKRLEGNSLVTIDDFLLMENETGRQIHTGDLVLIYTGYGEIYYDREKYFGTNLTGSEAVPHISLPGLAPEAAEWLVNERCISAIGIDTASIDHGRSPDFKSHQILTASGIPIFENVANLDKIVERGRPFSVIALPQKIEGGSGAPLRIIAVIA